MFTQITETVCSTSGYVGPTKINVVCMKASILNVPRNQRNRNDKSQKYNVFIVEKAGRTLRGDCWLGRLLRLAAPSSVRAACATPRAGMLRYSPDLDKRRGAAFFYVRKRAHSQLAMFSCGKHNYKISKWKSMGNNGVNRVTKTNFIIF